MSRYFGGSLELVSLDGWGKWMTMRAGQRLMYPCSLGTDVYLRLPKLVSRLDKSENWTKCGGRGQI